mmetsp:Transcript_28121/g.60500  ORF Transcript_28121/g.60500 Transcript_28121/m.60500 type:complete len:261 (-) Transcript_28121:804-1586(-)
MCDSLTWVRSPYDLTAGEVALDEVDDLVHVDARDGIGDHLGTSVEGGEVRDETRALNVVCTRAPLEVERLRARHLSMDHVFLAEAALALVRRRVKEVRDLAQRVELEHVLHARRQVARELGVAEGVVVPVEGDRVEAAPSADVEDSVHAVGVLIRLAEDGEQLANVVDEAGDEHISPVAAVFLAAAAVRLGWRKPGFLSNHIVHLEAVDELRRVHELLVRVVDGEVEEVDQVPDVHLAHKRALPPSRELLALPRALVVVA